MVGVSLEYGTPSFPGGAGQCPILCLALCLPRDTVPHSASETEIHVHYTPQGRSHPPGVVGTPSWQPLLFTCGKPAMWPEWGRWEDTTVPGCPSPGLPCGAEHTN